MFQNESITTKVEEVIPPQIIGFFDEGPSYPGLVEHAGKVKFNVYPDFVGGMLTSYGPDVVANAPTATYAPSASGGTLATGSYFVKVAAIYGDRGGVVASPASYIGVLGPTSVESASQSVTGPTGSIVVTITAPTQGPVPAGYVVWYTAAGGGAGSESLYVLTTTTSATIITTTPGAAVIASTTIGPATINLHTFSPRQTSWGANSVVQPYTFEVHRDMTNAFQYAGTVIEKL